MKRLMMIAALAACVLAAASAGAKDWKKVRTKVN